MCVLRQTFLLLKLFVFGRTNQLLMLCVHNSCSVQEVETIFEHLPDILELSTQLQVAIEEMIEMSSEMEGPRTPPIGFCFEESAEVSDNSLAPSLILHFPHRVKSSLCTCIILRTIWKL